MKKETLTRFDNENIVVIAIDEGQASGKIINEVAGTETPIGGGGGGDFTTASLTVTVEMPEDPQESIHLNLPIVYEAEGDQPAILFCGQTDIDESGTYEYTIALYKGLAGIQFSGNYVSSSGDIERQGPFCLVTGDATLSIMGLS